MSPRRALRGALDAGLHVRLFLFEVVVDDAGALFVIAFFGAIAAGAALAWFYS